MRYGLSGGGWKDKQRAVNHIWNRGKYLVFSSLQFLFLFLTIVLVIYFFTVITPKFETDLEFMRSGGNVDEKGDFSIIIE